MHNATNVKSEAMQVHAIDEREEILPGVTYGREDQILTPAYWLGRCHIGSELGHDFITIGGSLREEIGFCLLGGFGVQMEVAEAYYQKLSEHGVFEEGANITENKLFELLNSKAGTSRIYNKYRFPKQRAARIYGAMKSLDYIVTDRTNPTIFRNQLQTLKGIGPKTASWIARNWLGAEDIAIIDIHVLRAGWFMNLFSKNCKLPNDYTDLENRFVELSKALNVNTSVLDAVIWSDMRIFGSQLVLNHKLI